MTIEQARQDPGFRAYAKQIGLAGRKGVPRQEAQAAVDDYLAQQSQATQQATRVLQSVPDPAPNAAAASEAFSPTSMGYNDLGILAGGRRDPIQSTVEEVTAREQAQAAAQPKAPSFDDQFKTFAEQQIFPNIDVIRQNRRSIESTNFKYPREQINKLNALDGIVAQNISKLDSIGAWGPKQVQMYQSILEKEEGIPKEEALFRTINSRINPTIEQGGVTNQEGLASLEAATKTVEATAKALELAPESPQARQAHDAALSNLVRVQESAVGKPDMMMGYTQTLGKLQTLRNAQRERIPAIRLDGELVTEDKYDQLIPGLEADLGGYHASPEFRKNRPKIVKKGKTPEEFEAAVVAANGVYFDEEDNLVTPKMLEDLERTPTFQRFRTKDAPAAVNPPEQDTPSLARGEENMVRRMIEKGEDFTNTRFTPEVVESVRGRMEDEQIESALRRLYAGNSWMSMVSLRNPSIPDADMSGVLGRTNDPEAAQFLSKVDPEIVTRVYEKTGRLQGPNARSFKNSDGTWSKKVDPPEEVLFRIRQLASTRPK